jgi:hypothetical protein
MNLAYTFQASRTFAAPRAAQPIGSAAAAAIAWLTDWLRPRDESPAEAAQRLRRMANEYQCQPGFAADLLAAADRHEQIHTSR